MAQNPDLVIAKNISANGTMTLATAGKYCDRNIEVNVNVPIPSGYIKPTGSKNITANGTHDVTSVASAVVNVPVPSGYIKPSGSKTITENGTHDVTSVASAVVNVPQKATQFTNYYKPEYVTVNTRLDASSSSGVTYTADNYCNYIKIPFHHVKGEPVVLRLRGIGTIRDRFASVIFASDGATRVSHFSFYKGSYFDLSYDEYGDAMITFKGAIITSYEWYYFAFNFQYPCINSGATALSGPIITINEPIGNGGYAG